MEKVSVVIPVYNSVKFISKCLESIIGQTYKNLEILVVDAGSIDGTLDILEDYAKRDSRIRLLHSSKKSMGYQYNMGIKNATGEYIGFVESDDYIASTMYEKLLGYMKSYHLDYVKSDYDVFVEKEEMISLHYSILLGESFHKLYQKELCPQKYSGLVQRDTTMWNGLYDIEFIRKNHIFLNETSKAAFQDIGFVMKAFCMAQKIMYVNEKSYFYRRDNLQSSMYNPSALQFVVQEFEYLKDLLLHEEGKDRQLFIELGKRFLEMTSFHYGKIQSQEVSLISKEVIQRFREAFLDVYHRISYNDMDDSGWGNDLIYQSFLSNIEDFGVICKHIELIREKRLKEFFSHVNSYNRIIVFGSGRVGQGCVGFLKANHYKGSLIFCDNSSNLWGKPVMGIEIENPSEVLKREKNALFVIASAYFWKEISLQIQSAGVLRDNICRAVYYDETIALEAKTDFSVS